MKYLLLIQQGDTPTPNDPDAWSRLSEDEQKQVYADYQAINQTPGVTPASAQMQPPETATTVRVKGAWPLFLTVLRECGGRVGAAGRPRGVGGVGVVVDAGRLQ